LAHKNRRARRTIAVETDIDRSESHGFLNTGQSALVLLWIYDPPSAESKFISQSTKEGMA
jgi:hypothetical protein